MSDGQSQTEEINIGDQTLTIPVRPVTIICPSAASSMGPPIRYPKRIPLDAEATLYHAKRVQKLHAEFEAVWRQFMTNTTPPTEVKGPVTADAIRQMGTGAIHLMGLIDMTLKLGDQGVPVVWKYPESFLHPGWAVALGDLAIFFSRRSGGGGQVQVAEKK